MPKWIKLGVVATVALLLVAGMTVAVSYAGLETTRHPADPGSEPEGKVFTVEWLLPSSGPAAVDVTECNEYAAWIAEREAALDRITVDAEAADIAIDQGRYGSDALTTVGTIEGLSTANRADPNAIDAYRRCMVRRGYGVWG